MPGARLDQIRQEHNILEVSKCSDFVLEQPVNKKHPAVLIPCAVAVAVPQDITVTSLRTLSPNQARNGSLYRRILAFNLFEKRYEHGRPCAFSAAAQCDS